MDSHRTVPMRKLAGVEIPDTDLIRLATGYARQHASDAFFNHIQRCLVFGFVIAAKVPELRGRDLEVHALAAILHDLGFDPSRQLATSYRRCEVDSAEAARDFLEKHTDRSEWPPQRLQLVWDAIALHAVGSIAFHKEPEVKASTYGVWADFQGPEGVHGGLLTDSEYDRVVQEFPRLAIIERMKEAWIEQCTWKPETTYDTAGADIGDEYIETYSRKGHTVLDFLNGCNLDTVDRSSK
ncbi:hypothetical protein LTR84_010766 [Exophiala bonariae]|uniref:HD domain-containing protein n=1 Tax=Exophiala bonariae TaxID=1690606 RepID=A0AAV9MV56_9EURO|nr:hypothetical protein LTR84_010766 [Exophiala bonariae]